MPLDRDARRRFFATHHPFATLDEATRAALADQAETLQRAPGEAIYTTGERLAGFYAIAEGSVEVSTASGDLISRLHAGECFGERGLLVDGIAPYDARAAAAATLFLLPAAEFRALMRREPGFAQFFGRRTDETAAVPRPAGADLATLRIGEIMTAAPITAAPDDSAAETARTMRDHGISCVLVAEGGRLVGLVTASDLASRVLAAERPGDTPLREIMTGDPVSLSPEAIGLDAMAVMIEHGIGHLPVVEGARLAGILTRTDLLLRQALSSPMLVGEIGRKTDLAGLREVIAKVPDLLAQLVGAGAAPHVICRLITDVTDALTRKLIAMAEIEFGAPPVPYLWLVCGSQGRQEQTGVSDQDNCMILSDEATPEHDVWFAAFAKFVSDGLDACGFYYCPGEMMATNPKWRQPLATWQRYFRGWIDTPDPMARMLASVMFDLRPIAGDMTLFDGLHAETLRRARANSIFIAHMVANSLTHQPPLGLFRGFALVRSGEHKDSLDLKLNGVVPITDLARLYALIGGLTEVNTRARLIAAREAGLVSDAGGAELLDAYDMIAETRLQHQAEQIRRGARPDNFMAPARLSDLERTHLRNAFIVVKTMQAAAAQGRHTVV
ncbi:DUF294 nucleotidyltransferase-like domain-containing protein [Paralimibaculum aggregatum]|uniref:DUF294 nucleotidyltransferase-like domain-containing protein n=1 Tax=Paralimibaculum aggregatum TaxID=3036245 RepID=A0ABQ6LFR0_9RHOB|nr:DUF294 nucleotidyltransferase-like domain-containing protein [Limibaculum sp. NKW23]GMG81035.1 DUF294 nucleotidyltransferase-like domain-containing protein [Limibaculum sp. NKW23]